MSECVYHRQVYREVADSKEGAAGILELVDSVFRVFTVRQRDRHRSSASNTEAASVCGVRTVGLC